MKHCIVSAFAGFLLSTALSSSIFAQRATAVSGYVTSGGAPLVGARVRIEELKIDRTTDVEGRYSFLVPSPDVRGQTVTITATMTDRRLRYLPATARITLTGAPISQNFNLSLSPASQAIANQSTLGVPVLPRDSAARSSPQRPLPAVTVVSDFLEVDDAAGLGTLSSIVAGRIPGLRVSTSALPGGSSQMVFRGPRSALAPSQPLFIVDGLHMSNVVFTSSSQRFGFGGFDYGSSIDDLDLANVESIRFVRGSGAASLGGGANGANGAVVITTKSGAIGPRFAVSATHAMVGLAEPRLPEFQNSYGQGLNGAFSFFDGRGGGTNDGVAENWGPLLDGRPLSQSSYADSGQGDVRFWLPYANNLRDYFGSASARNTTASIQARTDVVSFYALVGDRNTAGIVPLNRLRQRDATLRFTTQLGTRFSLGLAALGMESKNRNAPGTGAADGSPIFQYLGLGRQVSTDSLARHTQDLRGRLISWNYAGHNNPWALVRVGQNSSRRYHTAASATTTYALTSSLNVSARGGIDSYRDGRNFTIPSGWQGGFPFYAGTGNFSRGGSQGDEISVNVKTGGIHLENAHSLAGGGRWTIGAGFDVRSNEQRVRSDGVDSAANIPTAGAPPNAQVPGPVPWFGYSATNTASAETGFLFANGLAVQGSVRNAWVTMRRTYVPGTSATAPDVTSTVLLPAVRASFDLTRGMLADSRAVRSAVLRGAWWLDASESNLFDVSSMYTGREVSGAMVSIASGPMGLDPTLQPEVTNGVEFGSDVAFRPLGLALGLTLYREQTSDVILPVTVGVVGTSVIASNAGVITNQGVEATASTQLGDGEHGFGWNVSANASRNSNRVDQLGAGQTAVALGPARWGVSVFAEPGQPLGVIRGMRLLRHSSGALILRDGLPMADSAAGVQRLGVAQPDWSFGLGSILRYKRLSLSAQADARLGGKIFSATNMIGTYTGTLASTAFRPDSGLLVAGIDVLTGQPNVHHVSAQDYYHALGSIAEPWVYSASFIKLRDVRLSATVPVRLLQVPFDQLRLSVIGRNVAVWSKAPNIDPETVFSPYQLPGVEMGQLPLARSFGVEITIVP